MKLTSLAATYLALTVVIRADISQEYCTTALKGVMSGGRCFYFIKTIVDWGQAWIECHKQNATLAQIHTSNESVAISRMLLNALVYGDHIEPVWVWLAMQRNQGAPSTCRITNDTTFWYDGPTTPNRRMNAGNTWIRYQSCGASPAADERYMGLKLYTKHTEFQNMVFAPDPSMPIYPLCQITNYCHNYTKSVTNECLTEIPVEVFNGTSIQACADACSSRMWCRSFEDVLDDACTIHTCKLFSWSSTDFPDRLRPGVTSSNPNCLHYDSDLNKWHGV